MTVTRDSNSDILSEGRPPPAEPAPILATIDPPESFDEDLAWIVSKYLQHTGARAAALSVHYRGEDEAELIFSQGGPDIDAGVIARLVVRGGEAGWRDRRREDGISPANWGIFELGGRDHLTLSLPLAADQHHRAVLTTLFETPPDAPRDTIHAAAVRLQPVLAGYFKLWLLVRAQRRRLDGMASAIDHTDVNVFLLDGLGNLMFVNASGEELLGRMDGLRRVGAMLAATDVGDTVKLRVAIDHVITADRDAARATVSIVPLRRGGGRRTMIAAIMPVEKPPRAIFVPTAILFVFDPDMNVAALLAPICQLYGLSPAESRLVGLLAEGFSVGEAAEKMRVKVPTLRTYLKQIFAKTGTVRQSDLIRLMMSSMVRVRARGGHRIL